MPEIPDVQYAEGNDRLIAYHTLGDHPIDVLHIGTWNQTVEGKWELPTAERLYRRLASFARLVLVDRRGSGLSDPLRSRYTGGEFAPWIEEGVSDVHIAARVVGLAGAGDVVVSRTIKDLVVGSGLRFEDRGVHALKGVPDEWQVFVVAS